MVPQLFIKLGACFSTESRIFFKIMTIGTFALYCALASIIFTSGLFGNMDCLLDVDPVLVPKDSVNNQCWTMDSFSTR